jgi:hypothetical protein
MSHRLRFLQEVEEDAIAGYRWYEEKAKGLGEEFLRVFYAGTEQVLDNPLAYARGFDDFRRYLLRRFPYALYCQIGGNQVIIFGLFHCARDPRTIKSNLQTRGGN